MKYNKCHISWQKLGTRSSDTRGDDPERSGSTGSPGYPVFIKGVHPGLYLGCLGCLGLGIIPIRGRRPGETFLKLVNFSFFNLILTISGFIYISYNFVYII